MFACYVWQVLKFKDGPNTHLVKNILIDQARIERTVLAGSVAEASHTLRDSSFMYEGLGLNV